MAILSDNLRGFNQDMVNNNYLDYSKMPQQKQRVAPSKGLGLMGKLKLFNQSFEDAKKLPSPNVLNGADYPTGDRNMVHSLARNLRERAGEDPIRTGIAGAAILPSMPLVGAISYADDMEKAIRLYRQRLPKQDPESAQADSAFKKTAGAVKKGAKAVKKGAKAVGGAVMNTPAAIMDYLSRRGAQDDPRGYMFGEEGYGTKFLNRGK